MKPSKKTQIKTLKMDGERYLPWIPINDWKSAQTHYEHLGRYYFASQVVKGKVVLDLACGEGYGADILAQTAKKVVGVDIDENTIKFANAKYKKTNLEFLHGEGSHIPITGEGIFDVICCFETIEHVNQDQQKLILAEFFRLIKNDGLLIISTPNYDYTHTVLKDYENHFHKKELQFPEFTQLMSTYFPHCLYYGQKNYLANQISEIKQNEGTFRETILVSGGEAVIESKSKSKVPQNYICVASKSLKNIHLAAHYTIDGDDSVTSNLYSLIELAQSERNLFQSAANDYLSAVHLAQAENDRCHKKLNDLESKLQLSQVDNDRCKKQAITQKKAHDKELNIIKLMLTDSETKLNQIYKSRSWKFLQLLKSLKRVIHKKPTESDEK